MLRYAVLGVAGFLAGMVNSVAGGGTLISFPALMWSGCNAVVANATSTVALWPGSLGGALGYRRQVSDAGRLLRWMIPPSLLGGGLGSLLLLRTDAQVFARLVPWLLLCATVLLALQETVTRRISARPSGRVGMVLAVFFQFLVGLYGGYFGAGIGILMLAVLGLLGETDIHRMNGMKNLFACCINGVAALLFIASGAVVFQDVLVVSLSALAGGWGGAGMALKLGRRAVRWCVVAIGLVLSLASFLRG